MDDTGLIIIYYILGFLIVALADRRVVYRYKITADYRISVCRHYDRAVYIKYNSL